MRTWVRDNGLLLANLALFAVFLVGMILTGLRVYNAEQVSHDGAPLGVGGYLGTGDFAEATFENWESEFLQMGMYVVLTAKLVTRGSSESKPVDKPADQDADPREHRDDPDAPAPVRRGGISLRIYENSLSLFFFGFFITSLLLHAVGGAAAYSAEELQHGNPGVTWVDYLGTSQFWFESFQNWQSEFLAVAAVVWASIYLRQRGSAESKPVHAPHREKTGG